MTDTITDITAHRTRHNTTAFLRWTDEMVSARLNVLIYIHNGTISQDDVPGPLWDEMFPGGYEPDKQPGHNLIAVQAEARRRGLI